MAHYLRDQHIQNISIDADALIQINNVFTERFRQLQTELRDAPPPSANAFFTYIIRFDGKGYRVFSLEELMRYFNQAKEVERLIFTIESGDALSSSRNIGAYLELCLDAKEPSRCVLVASSDNKDWAEASFAAVHEVLVKCRTKNGIARSPWTNFGVQIFGVVIGFIVSLWLSFKAAPNLKIENAFVIAFLFIFLIFSNIWGYLIQAILGLITKLFPNIQFIRPAKAQLHWLLQAIVGSTAFAVTVYFLGIAFSFLSKVLASFLNTGA